MTTMNRNMFGYPAIDWGSGDSMAAAWTAENPFSAPALGTSATSEPLIDTVAPTSGSWWSGFTGTTDAKGVKKDGWGGTALGAAQGLANLYMGMKQYGIAKDTLAENKRQFGLNYDAQRQTTNSSLEDRQRARIASNPGAYQSVSDYMTQNGVAPRG